MCMAVISSFIVLSCLNAELIIDHDDTWLDDFALDPMGQNGWKIDKISGYDLPNPNPIVTINNIPKYHGPFPARYNMERYLKCNTKHNTRIFVSFLTSYCNTDRKGDILQFNMFDPSNSSILPSFPQHPLNHKDKLLNPLHVPFIQNATSNYYSNHSSSSTIKPICSEPSAYDPNTTNSATSHLIPGQWYTSNTYKTFDLTIQGNHTYQIGIDMILFGETDEYVVISEIAVLCVQSEIPTKVTTNKPTSYPTIAPTEKTENPTKVTTNGPTSYPTINPTEKAEIPTKVTTNEPTSYLIKNIKQSPIWLGPSVQPTRRPSEYQTDDPTQAIILTAEAKIVTTTSITTTALDASQRLTKSISFVYVLVCFLFLLNFSI